MFLYVCVSLCLLLLLIFVVAVVIISTFVAFIRMLAIVMSTITLLVLIAPLLLIGFSVAITTYRICLELLSCIYLYSEFEVVIVVVVVFIVSTGLDVEKRLEKLENFVSFLAFMSAFVAMFVVTVVTMFVVVVIIMIAIVMTIITPPGLIVPSCFLALIVFSVAITIYSDPAAGSSDNCYFSLLFWRPYYCQYLWFSCVCSYSDPFSKLNYQTIVLLLSLRMEKETILI